MPEQFFFVGRPVDFNLVLLYPFVDVTMETDRSGTATIDLSEAGGELWVVWRDCDSCTVDGDPVPDDAFLGFVDNIVLVPEPTGLLLLFGATFAIVLRSKGY